MRVKEYAKQHATCGDCYKEADFVNLHGRCMQCERNARVAAQRVERLTEDVGRSMAYAPRKEDRHGR